MATQITNTATLTYRYGETNASATSNIAAVVLQEQLTAEKNSLSTQYTQGEIVTYTLRLSNNSASELTNIKITDDLGTYTIAGPVSVTPLKYIGPAALYVNGIYVSELTAELAAGSVSFTIPSLAGNSNAMIAYRSQINEYALKNTGAVLTNDVSVTADGLAEPVSASYTLEAADSANVQIVKSMSPDPVTKGGTLTYNFAVYNYGNLPAENVELTDALDPAPPALGVTIGGTPVAAADYSYTEGVLMLPAAGSALTVTIPAATFTQDPATGLVSTAPGVVMIKAAGVI